MTDSLSGLTALMLVAEKRSFTAAAVVLRVTPSAVSQAVRALEERVGVRLCQRTTRSVGLTEAGERFVARLRPALDDVHTAFESLNELRDRPAGKLRLNVPRLAYERLIEPHLTAFLTAYPEIELDLVIDDAFANIIESGCDAGIRIGESIDREMIAVRIGADERAAIVGSPSYFATHPKPKRPRDLHAHDCINYRRMRSGEIYRWEFTENGKDIEIAVHGRVTTNDGDSMVRSALAGAGLAYVLESIVRDRIKEGRLVRVLETFCPPFPGLHLYYPSRANLAPKLQVFIELLKKRAPGRAIRPK
jgi:DNA-binding transcriptional LysR family regulator